MERGEYAGHPCLKAKNIVGDEIRIIKWSDYELSILVNNKDDAIVVPMRDLVCLPVSLTDEHWRANAQRE
jgi:hypothetical protein